MTNGVRKLSKMNSVVYKYVNELHELYFSYNLLSKLYGFISNKTLRNKAPFKYLVCHFILDMGKFFSNGIEVFLIFLMLEYSYPLQILHREKHQQGIHTELLCTCLSKSKTNFLSSHKPGRCSHVKYFLEKNLI